MRRLFIRLACVVLGHRLPARWPRVPEHGVAQCPRCRRDVFEYARSGYIVEWRPL